MPHPGPQGAQGAARTHRRFRDHATMRPRVPLARLHPTSRPDPPPQGLSQVTGSRGRASPPPPRGRRLPRGPAAGAAGASYSAQGRAQPSQAVFAHPRPHVEIYDVQTVLLFQQATRGFISISSCTSLCVHALGGPKYISYSDSNKSQELQL